MLKINLWWRNNKKKIMCGGLIFLGLVLLGIGIWAYVYARPHYFYIDMEGNKGIAKWCKEVSAGLICQRDHGGKVLVSQYWKE